MSTTRMTTRSSEIRFETIRRTQFNDSAAQQFPPVFLPVYLDHLQQPARHAFYAVSSDGETRLPLLVKTARFFRRGQLLSPPLRQGVPLAREEEGSFLEALIVALRRERICHRLIQPTTNCVFQRIPGGARGCRFGSYRLALSNRSEETLLQGMHSTHRYEIRAALRSDATVRCGRNQLGTFFELYAATMRRSNLGHESWDFIEGLFSRLSSMDSICCAVVYSGDTPMAAALVPFTRNVAHYAYGGTATSIKPVGAVKLLHWEVIRQLRQRGVSSYDFVGARLSNVAGTKLDGIQRFKERFGGELTEGWLWKCDITPTVSRLFDLAVGARRMMRRGGQRQSSDIIEQELRKDSLSSLADLVAADAQPVGQHCQPVL